jgi:hypothetical protein
MMDAELIRPKDPVFDLPFAEPFLSIPEWVIGGALRFVASA